MDVASFEEIAVEFQARTARIAWCTVATVDAKGRPRSRILHPIWEGSTGWIATGRQSFKARHLEGNPYVSLTYWDPQHEQVYADCLAAWEDDPAEKARIWDLYGSTPPPLGYDLALFFRSKENPGYGLLRLQPWRIELSSLSGMMRGEGPRVWHR